MRVGIIGGSIAGCATAALLHRAGHDVIVFERSESDLVSRGAGILMTTAAWQDVIAHGLIDGTLPACRADYSRLVTRASGTGQQRWLGDFQMSFTLLNWAHLYQGFRRRVPDDLYRSGAAVERIETTPHGTTLHLLPDGSWDFDLVVCADGYRSLGRGLIDPGAAPAYRGMVLWRGLLPERGIRVDALTGCDLLRPVTRGATGSRTTSPDPGRAPNRGNAFSCGATTSRFRRAPWPRAPAVDDALRQWSEAQLQAAAQVIPNAEGIERGYVFGMPDLTTMSTTATNDWMSATYPGLVLTLPSV